MQIIFHAKTPRLLYGDLHVLVMYWRRNRPTVIRPYLKSVSLSHNYTIASNILFIVFSVFAVIGVLIMLFGMGEFHKNEELHKYVLAEEAEPALS